MDRFGKYIFLSARNVELAQKWFDRYGLITVFVARLLPVVRTFISLPAGFARVHFIRFIVYTMLGSIPWTIALIYAGMLLGANWEVIRRVGHEASLLVAASLVVLAFYYSRKKRGTD